MKIKILYTDKAGIARFTDYLPNFKVVNERVSLSAVTSSSGFQFRDSPPEVYNPWHCTAKESTQWVIVTNGIMRVGLRDGSLEDFYPGDMFLSMDTQPEDTFQDHNGHTSQAVGKDRLNTMFIKVDYEKCIQLLNEQLARSQAYIMELNIISADKAKWDNVSLGDVMLRLDPGESRIRTAREFKVWEGGGEYNVSRALTKVFAQRTSHILGFVENDIGYLLLDLIKEGGVDVSHSVWKPYDGIGHTARIGLNFTERGFGVRGALGAIDRAHAASGQIDPKEIDWNKIFEIEKTRWFHTGGIFIALTQTSPKVMLEAFSYAKKNGAIISYDMNFRASLWKFSGNSNAAVERNREAISKVDVLFGGVDDFQLSMGINLKGLKENIPSMDSSNFEAAVPQVIEQFPNLKIIATTLRTPKTATRNDWSGVAYYNGKFYKGTEYRDLEILDRVGGGDGFAAGIIYSMLNNVPIEKGVNLGLSCGALAMTTPGDSCNSSLAEVEHLASGGNARTER